MLELVSKLHGMGFSFSGVFPAGPHVLLEAASKRKSKLLVMSYKVFWRGAAGSLDFNGPPGLIASSVDGDQDGPLSFVESSFGAGITLNNDGPVFVQISGAYVG